MTDSPAPAPPPAPEAEDADDLLVFTPVPLTPRHNGWTPRRQRDFIAALAVMGVVSRAARAVGMTKQAAYKLRARPGAESFATAWDVALAEGYDRAYELAVDQALNGITTPRFYKGRQVGTRHRYDYRLAMAALIPPRGPPRTRPPE
jgi:hypothetical protein